MSSGSFGSPKMILPYEWILKNVEEEDETIASKMILFRGERVFRVGLKNHVETHILFFMVVDLNKIGMRVEDVRYGIQESDNGPATLWEMKIENIGNEGSLQLFTIELAEKISGNCTFSFRICIEGSVPGYFYQLSDRLVKDQLWAAATVKSQNSVDVEFLLNKKKLFAHKAILAARSPVFAAEFAGERQKLFSFLLKVDEVPLQNSELAEKPSEEPQNQSVPLQNSEFQEEELQDRDFPWNTLEPKKMSNKERKKKKEIRRKTEQLSDLMAPLPSSVQLISNNNPVKDAGAYQIRMDGVNPSTMEQFLHFIYTGEFTSTLANEELLKLAEHYQLITLTCLCKMALKKSDDALQMVSIVKSLHNECDDGTSPSPKISPEKDTEILFDRTASTFRCIWKFPMFESVKPNAMANYQNETLFFAYVIPRPLSDEDSIHFSCAKLRNIGVKVEEVYMNQRSRTSEWIQMKSTRQPSNSVLLFTAPTPTDSFHEKCQNEVVFDTRIVGTIGNYYYEIMDGDWMEDIWTAAINKQFTDVEIFVGTVKVMEAHRVVLVARSPVLNASLGMTSGTGKPVVTIDEEFDVDVVKLFLQFLYTGSLAASASHQQLLTLATMYEVETLKNVCQYANRPPKDVEDLTNSLLELV